MLSNKQSRAELIVAAILAQEPNAVLSGSYSPSKVDRLVRIDPRAPARITPDTRMVWAPQYENIPGDRPIDEPGTRLLTVTVTGAAKLIINLRDGHVCIYRYVPGGWETWFGVDCADDHVTFGPECVAFLPADEQARYAANIRKDLEPLRRAPETAESGFNACPERHRTRSGMSGHASRIWPTNA